MYAKILVPIDGSALGAAPLAALTTTLRPLFSELVLMSAVGAHDHEHAVADAQLYLSTEDLAAAFRSKLEARAADLSASGTPARVVIRQGEPVEAILATLASDAAIGAVSMTTHGRWGFGHQRLGRVPSKVLHHAPVPLLFVPPDFGKKAGPAPRPLERVLVPIDSSAESLAIRFALAPLLDATRCAVRLLFVQHGVMRTTAQVTQHDEVLSRALAAFREVGIEAEAVARFGEDVDDEIARGLLHPHGELVAMATHGRSGPMSWLLGSYAESLLPRLSVPALVVRMDTVSA